MAPSLRALLCAAHGMAIYIAHRSAKVIVVCRAGVKVEMLVEAAGFVVLGMDDHGADTGDVGSLEGSGKSVVQHGGAKALALGRVVDRKSGQQHHGYGMAGQSLDDPQRRLRMRHGSDSQAVITDDALLADVFGIELDEVAPPVKVARSRSTVTTKKAVVKKAAPKKPAAKPVVAAIATTAEPKK